MDLALVIVVYCLAIVGMSFLFLKLTDRLREGRENRAYERLKREHPERVCGTDEYLARFDHPDFAALEAHINRPLPLELKKLYADAATLRSEDLVVIPPDSPESEDTYPVLYFFPADGHAITDLWPEYLDSSQVPFATDGSCGVYYVELGTGDENDPPVCIYYDDGDIHSEVASSLSEFLSWRRASSDEVERL